MEKKFAVERLGEYFSKNYSNRKKVLSIFAVFLAIVGFFVFKPPINSNIFLELKCELGNGRSCNQLAHREYVFNSQKAADSLFKKARAGLKKECDSGAHESCFSLAELFLTGRGGEQDPEKAKIFFKSSCERGVIEACKTLSTMYAWGRSIKIDLAKSKELDRIACNAGHFSSCPFESDESWNSLKERARKACMEGKLEGCLFFRNEDDLPESAANTFAKFCDGNDPRACGKLAFLQKDENKKMTFLLRACSNGDDDSCTYWASIRSSSDKQSWRTDFNLIARVSVKGCKGTGECLNAIQLFRSEGKTEIESENLSVLEKYRCALGGAVQCSYLGSLKAEEKEFFEAKNFYLKSCEWGLGAGCKGVGELFDAGRFGLEDFAEARRYFNEGCQYEYPDSCAALGIYFRYGRGGEKDLKKADELLKSSCDKNSRIGCRMLGAISEDERSYLKAKQYYGKSCEGNDPYACYRLGMIADRIDDDYAKAREFLYKACTWGSNEGCFQVGLLYANGLGGPMNQEKGQRLFIQACKAGVKQACRNLD